MLFGKILDLNKRKQSRSILLVEVLLQPFAALQLANGTPDFVAFLQELIYGVRAQEAIRASNEDLLGFLSPE